jgi:hypothetical protein
VHKLTQLSQNSSLCWFKHISCVITLALGSRPRQGLAKVQAKWEVQESHFILLGVWESLREWTPTLPSELPLWELEFPWTFESSKNDCKDQNPLDWEDFYIIKKILKLRCLEWARMTHLDTSNTSYGQKKGQKSNWQFDSRPLKVKNCPDFLACRWFMTYCWKDLDKGYKFVLDLILIRGLHTKLWVPKVIIVPTLGILGLPFESPRTKWHLGADPNAKHKIYYKGEGGGFPKFGPWWISWIHVCPWLFCAPKVL